MANDDPAALLAGLCRISSSQEYHLSSCKFAGEPDDESSDDDDDFDDIPVASTGIMIVSPPDTLEDQEHEVSVPRDNDVFHTPPEEHAMEISQEQQQMVSAHSGEDRAVEVVTNDGNFDTVDGNCTDDLRAVDLGRDTDQGFSAEAELTERIAIDPNSLLSPGVNQVKANEVIHESVKYRVREREIDAGDCLYECPQKKLKTANENLGLATPEPCLGSEAAKILERVTKSIEKLKSPLKISNTLNENVMLETSGDASGAKTGKMDETVKNWSFEGINLLESSESVQNHQIEEEVHGGDGEFQGTSSARRKLNFPSEASEPKLEVEDNAAVSIFNENRVVSESEKIEDDIADGSCDTGESRPKDREAKSIEDIDKCRYVGSAGANSSKKHKDTKQKRVLPMSLRANSEAAEEPVPAESSCTSDDKEVTMSFWTNNGEGSGEVVPVEVSSTGNDQAVRQWTLFDVLRELAKQFPYDPRAETLSVVDVMKLRGMTFP